MFKLTTTNRKHQQVHDNYTLKTKVWTKYKITIHYGGFLKKDSLGSSENNKRSIV
jgi:hypothetical protein